MESEPKLLGNAGVSRRQLLARSAVAAGVVWAAPVVRTASAYAATSAGTTRPCTQFFVAGISLNGEWFPAYPYGFVPSVQATENLTGTPPTTTTTTTVPLATPGQGGAASGVQNRRPGTGRHKLTKRELAALFDSDTSGTGTTTTDSKVTVPRLIEQWVRENPDVPLLEPSVYPQLTQTGSEGWAILLPEVVGPNAAARQPRFILGYAWQGSQYAYGYVDPRPANPALAGRRILFPSPVGREPGVGDTTTTTTKRKGKGRTTTTSSSSTSSTTSTTTTPGSTTTVPAPAFGSTPPPSTTTTSSPTTTTSSTTTTTSTTTSTTTTTLPPAVTTTTLPPTTTTTLPPTTTTTRPGWGKGGSKQTTTTTAPPPTTTTTTVPPTTTSSTTTTTLPGGGSTTTTTTTSPSGTTTTTTDPFSQWWIAANSGGGNGAWDGLVPKGSKGGNGATSGSGKKTGFIDTGVGPAGPAGPGALSPTDAKPYADYFGPLAPTTDPNLSNGVQGAPIKGVILIYCQP